MSHLALVNDLADFPLTDTAAAAQPLRQRGSNQDGVRQFNERVVLQALRAHGALAKADLARLTGLTAQASLATEPGQAAPPSTTDVPAAPRLSLAGLFERAWASQPEARSADLRRQSLVQARVGSRSWLAGAPSLLLQAQTDRPGTGQGERELEVGLALPLWRPGQSAKTQATHEAEATAHEHQLSLQRWRLAGVVREAWWYAQRTHTDLLQAQARVQNARELAHDVARRVQAGDLARADQHQAESAVAQALWTLAQAQGAQESALEQLRQLSGDWSLSSPPVDRTALEPAYKEYAKKFGQKTLDTIANAK